MPLDELVEYVSITAIYVFYVFNLMRSISMVYTMGTAVYTQIIYTYPI